MTYWKLHSIELSSEVIHNNQTNIVQNENNSVQNISHETFQKSSFLVFNNIYFTISYNLH